MNMFQLLTNPVFLFWLFVFSIVFLPAIGGGVFALCKMVSNHFLSIEKEKTKQLNIQLTLEKERSKHLIKEPTHYIPYESGYQENPPMRMGE